MAEETSSQPGNQQLESPPSPQPTTDDEEATTTSPPDHSDENEATKIIVLQLSFNSTEQTVMDYFSKFGEIEKLDLKRYPDGSSRGFAFIVFKTEEALSKLLGEQEHHIDNRKVTVEKARTRSEKMQTNKIFIGKLPAELTEDNLRDYFSTFGEIDEIQFVFNKQTNERKSFCFIQFKTTEAVEKITDSKVPPESKRHTIESFEIECKKKFDDNHPIQRKIKAIERQKKGWDYYGNYQGSYGYGSYDGQYYGQPYYGGYSGGYGGYYGPQYQSHRGDNMYGTSYNNGYGHEEYNTAYNGYYSGKPGNRNGVNNNNNNRSNKNHVKDNNNNN